MREPGGCEQLAQRYDAAVPNRESSAPPFDRKSDIVSLRHTARCPFANNNKTRWEEFGTHYSAFLTVSSLLLLLLLLQSRSN